MDSAHVRHESIDKNPSQITSLLNPSKSSQNLSNLNKNKTENTLDSCFDSHNSTGKNDTHQTVGTTQIPSLTTSAFNVSNAETQTNINENPENVSTTKDADMDKLQDHIENDDIYSPSDNDSLKENSNTGGSSKLPPRKRSKVSRACDECRRKKVRCNAVFDVSSNSITKICTNCEKNNDPCTFTRIPLKRGPTKGYNKKPSSSTSSSSRKPRSRPRSRANSMASIKSTQSAKTDYDSDVDSLKYQQHLSMTPQSQPHQKVILPPLNLMSYYGKQPDNTNSSTNPNAIALVATNGTKNNNGNDNNDTNNISSNINISPNIGSSNNVPLNTNNGTNKQEIFWKVPTDMPVIKPESLSPYVRKNSIDSTNSSLSSSSILASNSRKLLLSNASYRSNSKGSIVGIENSDSEDEFFMNNSNRISRSSFQVPFSIPNTSPRLSIASDNDQRSRVSSLLSPSAMNSSPSLPVPTSPGFNSSQLDQNQQHIILKSKSPETSEAIYNLLDNYYTNFYLQYPLLPHPEIVKLSVASVIDHTEFASIIELFVVALKTIDLDNSNMSSQSNAGQKFVSIARAFETACSMFLSKSFIYSSIPAKIILTSTFIILNYVIVLSGYDYSLGFGISFSYFKDWLIFKEGYDSPCFANLIQLVVLDSLHTLYFGVPRSSTVCFAIDSNFIASFLKEIKFLPNVEFEWLSIGLHLVVLNNNLQQLDSLDKLENILVTGTEYKFMLIIKLYYELFVYCRKINIKNVVSEYNSQGSHNNGESLNDFLKGYLYNIELESSKLCKKLTNLIDEQLDDLEIAKPNVLTALILMKCMHISVNIEIFIKSIIHLNDTLESSVTKSLFNPDSNQNVDISITTSATNSNNDNRSRSSSLGSSTENKFSKGTTAFFTNLSDYNKRSLKIIDNVKANMKRSLGIQLQHQHCQELLSQLYNSTKVEINVPRTNNIGGVEYSVVIQNWFRLVNGFFANEITKEGINGWCYM